MSAAAGILRKRGAALLGLGFHARANRRISSLSSPSPFSPLSSSSQPRMSQILKTLTNGNRGSAHAFSERCPLFGARYYRVSFGSAQACSERFRRFGARYYQSPFDSQVEKLQSQLLSLKSNMKLRCWALRWMGKLRSWALRCVRKCSITSPVVFLCFLVLGCFCFRNARSLSFRHMWSTRSV